MLFVNCLFCTFCSWEKLPHRTVKSYPLLKKPKPSLSPADFRDTQILSSSITGEWNPRLEMRKDSSTNIWNSRGWASVGSKGVAVRRMGFIFLIKGSFPTFQIWLRNSEGWYYKKKNHKESRMKFRVCVKAQWLQTRQGTLLDLSKLLQPHCLIADERPKTVLL